MRALCLDYELRTLVEREVSPAQPPSSGEVLLRIEEIGVCATDRELARFRFGVPPEGDSYLILGHEALAQVEWVGADVTTLHRGDWVTPLIRRNCAPQCGSCVTGRRDLCETGQYFERGINRAHGYFTECVTDPEADLLPVPESLLDVAVLAEPLSVVEKAIETAFRCHPLTPRTAIITGAGPVGLLAAFALQVRGLAVTVVSKEPEDHPRVALLRRAGVVYMRSQAPPPADIVMEASGAAEATLAALEWIAPHGVFILIGAPELDLPVPALRMILENLTVAGVVNAARQHFEAALYDLGNIPRPWLESLIERRPFDAWRDSLAAPAITPKTVHRVR
ncbi:MAG: alcohol dehydrogenase catalytic domain-containing protein [Bryobacterales bacterium]|nr:alcohol dehydrogenase catalytic domain-containing protein [Bryobacterales bacterium]